MKFKAEYGVEHEYEVFKKIGNNNLVKSFSLAT